MPDSIPEPAKKIEWPVDRSVHPDRIVIKIGTGVLTHDDRVQLDEPAFLEIARATAHLKKLGFKVILVSSGAVGAGLTEFGLTTRPTDVAELQSYAAIGQSLLLQLYRRHFKVWDLHVGQVLLTLGDIYGERRRQSILGTLNALLEKDNVVPIVNENDTTASRELKFDSNDILAANVAALVGAKRLLMLTTVDGLLERNEDGSQKLVSEVTDMNAALSLVEASTSSLSVGGMEAKLNAVQFALEHGVETFIANGKHASRIPELLSGHFDTRTRFEPEFEPEPVHENEPEFPEQGHMP